MADSGKTTPKSAPPPPVQTFGPMEDDGKLPTTPGLPYGWTGPTIDEKSGRTYYRNMKTGKTQDRPPPPPPPKTPKKDGAPPAIIKKPPRPTSISSVGTIDSSIDDLDTFDALPVPPIPPMMPIPEIKVEAVYECLADPGLGFRSEQKWEAKVEGKGIRKGQKIVGEVDGKWLYVKDNKYWLPITHDGKTLLRSDESAKHARKLVMNGIKRGKALGARAKLLGEIERGKLLKRVDTLRDVGLLVIEASILQEAISENVISTENATRLWKFLAQRCEKVKESKKVGRRASTVMEKMERVKKTFDQKKITELVLALKEAVKPKTMTYVKKKYHNCISGAEVMFFLETSKICESFQDKASLGKYLLNSGMLKSASAKKMNNVKGLPIRADQFYRYGDIVRLEGYLERSHKNMFNNKNYKKRYYRLIECGVTARTKKQEYRLASYLKKIDDNPHSVTDVTNARLDPIPRLALEFVVKTSRQLRLKAPTSDDKKAWVQLLKSILGASQVEQKEISTFGSRLSKVQKSSKNPLLPKVVHVCVEYLREHGMKTEGIFRKPGLHDRIEDMKKCFDHDVPIKFGKQDIHAAAGCLKQWLRELPEPLIPHNFYSMFLGAESASVSDIQKMVRQLPSQNQAILAYLCQFLNELSKNHEITRMNIPNLALVFSPNILRPKTENPMEALAHSQRKNDSLTAIIKDVYDIFKIPKPDSEIDFL
mmetsp:Transcript_2933/g.4308  ORF Transcript_2933/g.4308 Transcript_2933/m.4308 type:complete len:709 (-) Transcript_2933:95-2221(-)